MKRLTFLLLIAALAAQTQAGVPDPTGAWEFNPPDPSRATIGAPLELVGTVEKVAGIDADDGAIQIGEGSYYICTHGVAPNGGGAKVNEWTLLIDFSYPPSSRSDPPNGYNDLFQTNPTDADDADWTINSSGAIGIGAVGYSSASGYTTQGDTWYRMVLVVDNGTRHDLNMDGVVAHKGTQQGVDGRFSLASTILLFCAGNNQDRDDAPINVSAVAFWDTALDADQVLALGRAGDKFYSQTSAWDPTPADGSDDVPVTTGLSWAAGEFAATHDVYFGLSREDVAAAAPATLIAEGLALDVDSLEIERLDYGQTYYWRVDEVNATPDSTVFKGSVWSFTTETYAYPITSLTVTASAEQPTSPAIRTIDGSGLDALDQHGVDLKTMWATPGGLPAWIQYEFDKEYKLHELWVWNSNSELEAFMGFGSKDVAIEYSSDGEIWTPLENVPPFAQGTGKATYTANTVVDFGEVMAKYVRLTISAGWGATGMVGLSEVRFFYTPAQAFEPSPSDGATGVDLDAELTWRLGREATSHEVYFGTDATAVADGTVTAETVTDPRYIPSAMEFGTTYYWKVDEVGDAGTYEGELWSFTAQEFAPIDDFESYDDDMEGGTTIWHAWMDGVTTKASGSQVGYTDAPFAEQKIVHGGRQSMPLMYDNETTFSFSEAEREFDTAQNWTGNGATDVCLWTRGYPALTTVAVAETSGKMDLTGAGTDIWSTSDEFTYAYKTLTGDGALVARVVSTGTGSQTWAKGGVMIRDSLAGSSMQAMMAMTTPGANGASFQYRTATGGTSAGTDSSSAVAAPYWVKIERSGEIFRGFVSANGTNWTQVGTATIAMTDPVYIGLCVTSHEAGVDRTYQFDSIASTGAVAGAWQGAVIDSPQFNAAANMYLLIQDSNGKSATATSATAVTAADWTQWTIPMADFAGVNFAKVKKMVITVGDKNATTAGGSGIVFIDDIGFGRSAE
ncbi:MAG: discoidin domain-containing protein [Phycisphaerales bacterium]